MHLSFLFRIQRWSLWASSRAVKSNWFWCDSIFDSKSAETIQFDLILIQLKIKIKKPIKFIQNCISCCLKKLEHWEAGPYRIVSKFKKRFDLMCTWFNFDSVWQPWLLVASLHLIFSLVHCRRISYIVCSFFFGVWVPGHVEKMAVKGHCLSQSGFNLLKEFEGLRLEAYQWVFAGSFSPTFPDHSVFFFNSII